MKSSRTDRQKRLGQNVAITACMGFGLLISACGTQTGNPPASPPAAPLEPAVINGLTSLAYTETIDVMNTGDYLFGITESRVINQAGCRNLDSGQLALVKSTKTEHSVQVSRQERESLASLSIARSYTDRWYAQGEELDCDPNSGGPRLNLRELPVGEGFTMRTDLNEEKFRELEVATLGTVSETLVQESAIEKSGTRNLSFQKAQPQSTALERWDVSASEDVLRQLRLTGNQLEAGAGLEELLDSDLKEKGLAFSFDLDLQAGEILRYRLKDQQVNFRLSNEQLVILKFEGVELKRSHGCFPVQGKIVASYSSLVQQVELSWEFEDGEIVSGDPLAFLPEACVLNER